MEKHTARKYSSPIRERQSNQTRTNILDATQRLFLERGYAKTTVEAIAQEAGVAKQTVYAVFRSKNGIVAELLDRAVFTERVFEAHGAACPAGARIPKPRLRPVAWRGDARSTIGPRPE